MNRCTLAALCAVAMTGFLFSMLMPSHPEQPFVEEIAKLRADNMELTREVIAYAKEQVADEKKRTEAALKTCGK